jgi:hypothetical protein
VLRSRGLVAAGLAGLIAALVVAAPVDAEKKQKYRFTFTQVMHADWQWPVNQFNHNQRDTGSFEVQSGKGCGTAPSKAVWTIEEKSGDQLPPNSLIVDLVHGTTKNPAPVVDENYGGTPSAEVKFFLKFGKKPTSKVKLSAQPQGDVVGPTFTASSAPVKAKKVKHC